MWATYINPFTHCYFFEGVEGGGKAGTQGGRKKVRELERHGETEPTMDNPSQVAMGHVQWSLPCGDRK